MIKALVPRILLQTVALFQSHCTDQKESCAEDHIGANFSGPGAQSESSDCSGSPTNTLEHTSEQPEQRRQAVNSRFFITEKRDGKIKGRTAADGSKQMLWINRESIVWSCIEEREVAVPGMPKAFIQTKHDKLTPCHQTHIVKVKGSLAHMSAEIDST